MLLIKQLLLWAALTYALEGNSKCISFLGNSDCSRWDSPQHILMDDGQESDRIWQGSSMSYSKVLYLYAPR